MADTISDFPIADFFNISDEIQLQNIRENLMCNGYSHEIRKNDCCSCQDDCMQTKTCCVDALWNRSSFKSIDEYKKHLISSSNQAKNVQCITLVPDTVTGISISSRAYYSMVVTCADGASELENKECTESNENVEYFVPVKGSDSYTYRNQYCATCNFVDEFQAVKLNFEFPSNGNKGSVEAVIVDGHECSHYSKQCELGHEYYDLCHAFLGPITGFSNNFFYLCSGKKENPILEVQSSPRKQPVVYQTFNWSLEYDDMSKKSSCYKQKIADMFLNDCNSLPCPKGYVSIESKCKKIVSRRPKRALGGGGGILTPGVGGGSSLPNPSSTKTIDQVRFDNCLSMPRIQYYNVFGAQNLTETKLQNILITLKESKLAYEVLFNTTFKTIVRITGLKSRIEIDLMSFLMMLDDTIFKLIITSNHYLDNNLIEANYLFPHQRICAVPEILDIQNITDDCEVKTVETMFKSSNLSFYLEVNSFQKVRHLYWCRVSYLYSKCPLRVINSSFTLDGFDLVYSPSVNTTEVFKVSEYISLDFMTFGVCRKCECPDNAVHALPRWSEIANRVEGVMSLVGAVLSIPSYVFQSFMFLIFKDLQNFSGLSVLVLSMSLLITDASFFAGKALKMAEYESNQLCQALGIVSHISLLVAFYWGVVITSNVLNTVRSNLIEQYPAKAKLMIHIICSFVISAVVVATGVLLDHFKVVIFTYGNDGICALHGYDARWFSMAIPLGISSVLSLISLLVSVFYISQEASNNREILGDGNFVKMSKLKVAVKVIVITGFAEVIGLVDLHDFAQNDDNELIVETVFSFLYSLLKGFRGAMLFAVYSLERLVAGIRKRKNAIEMTKSRVDTNYAQQEGETSLANV